jgi:CRP-like cAMP-binding protein
MHLKCEVPFFFDFDRHTLENLTKVMTKEVYQPGDLIFKQGDEADKMCIIIFGKVGLFREKG